MTCHYHGHVVKAKRDKSQQSIYLEPEKAKLLDKLAEESGIPKAVLLRLAVDALLEKHGMLKRRRKT
jgi:predicted DNA-binding protein